MKKRLWFSLCRLAIAATVVFVAALPNRMSAVTCTTQQYGGSICTQCYVYSPLGWIPVGSPKWVTQ
jgi:hypothetical protein